MLYKIMFWAILAKSMPVGVAIMARSLEVIPKPFVTLAAEASNPSHIRSECGKH